MNRIADYIYENPQKWTEKFATDHSKNNLLLKAYPNISLAVNPSNLQIQKRHQPQKPRNVKQETLKRRNPKKS